MSIEKSKAILLDAGKLFGLTCRDPCECPSRAQHKRTEASLQETRAVRELQRPRVAGEQVDEDHSNYSRAPQKTHTATTNHIPPH